MSLPDRRSWTWSQLSPLQRAALVVLSLTWPWRRKMRP